MAGLRPCEISDSTSATATAANRSGTQIPSLSPLSTFRPWRIRCGTRGSVTTAWPSAASVGANTIARITASSTDNCPKIQAAATAPSAIVSGRPMPSRRSGTPASRRRRPRSMREASQNSTSARVASASVRTAELELSVSISPSTLGPTSNPMTTNSIVAVRGVPDSRPETAPTASSVSATMARDQSIPGPSLPGDHPSIRRRLARTDRGARRLALARRPLLRFRRPQSPTWRSRARHPGGAASCISSGSAARGVASLTQSSSSFHAAGLPRHANTSDTQIACPRVHRFFPGLRTRTGTLPYRLRSFRLLKSSMEMPMAQIQRGTPSAMRIAQITIDL